MEQVADRRLEQVSLKLLVEHPEAISMFPAEVFSTAQHQILYDKICKAHEQGFHLDKNILTSFLNESNLLPQVGEHTIDSIFELSYEEDFISDYSQRLREVSIIRKAQYNLYSLAETAPRTSISELASSIKEVESALYSEVGVTNENELLSDLVSEELKSIYSNQESSYFKTSFSEFDTLVGGLEESDLMLIAGRTSMGKSSLMLRWMLNFAYNGYPGEVYSLEMSNTQLVRRILSMESGIPSQRLKQGVVSDAEKETLRKLAAKLNGVPLTFKYTSLPKINALANHIRLSHQANGTKVFAVDYVQLMHMTPGNETTDIGRIAATLKALAKELNVGIILLSQLNRSVESRKDKHPVLSDLRQSGALEENADKIIFVYRDYYYTQKSEDHGLAELILAKNRNGPIGIFNAMFNEETTNFWI